MKLGRVLWLGILMVLCLGGMAQAEGFHLSEWSARGLGLAGGMVGRADDPSAIAYNAAGITQLPGTQVMVGGAFVAPFGSASLMQDGEEHYTQTKMRTWTNGHAYLTHQLNDSVWLGLGAFSRFGVGVNYGSDWLGRYNMYDVGLQTVSVVPTIAYKVNDWLSLSLGGEFLYAHLFEGKKANLAKEKGLPTSMEDIDAQMEGQGIAGGVHVGALVKFNEQWSLGVAYKSQMTLNMSGDLVFGNVKNGLGVYYPLGKDQFRTSDLDGTVQLPDQIAVGLAYRPTDKWSFEVGTVWTRWSTYEHLNIYVDAPYGQAEKSRKDFRDGWNFNASAEWKALDWLTVRAGAYYETPVVNEDHADYMIPSYGRTAITAGLGFHWNDFTLDMGYVHMWVNPLDYDSSAANGTKGVLPGHTENCVTNIYSMSLSYTF